MARTTTTLRHAGLARKGLTFYSMRHTFASDLATAGASMAQIASLLGNTPRTAELHYAHLQPGRTAQVVKVIKAIEPERKPYVVKSGERAASSAPVCDADGEAA